jgi:uncharacterized coiled-coil DUF342 family protein
MGLLALLKNDEKAEVARAWKRYAELVELDDANAAKALPEMKSVMQTLGKTAADAERDAATMRTARHMLAVIKNGSCLAEQIGEAQKAVVDFYQETERLRGEREQRHAELTRISDQLGNRAYNAQMSIRSLNELVGQHPSLLRDIEVPSLT